MRSGGRPTKLGCFLLRRERLVSRPLRLLGPGVSSLRELERLRPRGSRIDCFGFGVIASNHKNHERKGL